MLSKGQHTLNHFFQRHRLALGPGHRKGCCAKLGARIVNQLGVFLPIRGKEEGWQASEELLCYCESPRCASIVAARLRHTS